MYLILGEDINAVKKLTECKIRREKGVLDSVGSGHITVTVCVVETPLNRVMNRLSNHHSSIKTLYDGDK
jgi:hypothetical protein